MARWFFVGIVFLLVIFSWDQQAALRWVSQPTSVNALYYNNRNECNSVRVNYKFIFSKDQYTLEQEIWLKPTRNVTECFFYMDMDFQLTMAELKIGDERHPIILEFTPTFFVARIKNTSWIEGVEHFIKLNATRPFQRTDEGIVFRTFRSPETRVK